MSRTVLFDLDGTLLDTERDFTHILNHQLTRHGRKSVHAVQVRNNVSSGARALVKLGFGIDENHSEFPAYLDELLTMYQEKIPHTECVLFPGIGNLLSAMKKTGCRWGIVTNKPSRFTVPLVRKFPALEDAEVIICADQLQKSKPDPEGILLACSRLGCDPAEVLYVGDHPKDMSAARQAGASGIAVRWGYIPVESPIEQWQADYIINHPDEILDHALTAGQENADV